MLILLLSIPSLESLCMAHISARAKFRPEFHRDRPRQAEDREHRASISDRKCGTLPDYRNYAVAWFVMVTHMADRYTPPLWTSRVGRRVYIGVYRPEGDPDSRCKPVRGKIEVDRESEPRPIEAQREFAARRTRRRSRTQPCRFRSIWRIIGSDISNLNLLHRSGILKYIMRY